jgi:hypothetical protein
MEAQRRVVSCAPDDDAQGMDLVASGIVGCVAGRVREGLAVSLSITVDPRSIPAIRSRSVRSRFLAGAVAAGLHARGMLTETTRRDPLSSSWPVAYQKS